MTHIERKLPHGNKLPNHDVRLLGRTISRRDLLKGVVAIAAVGAVGTTAGLVVNSNTENASPDTSNPMALEAQKLGYKESKTEQSRWAQVTSTAQSGPETPFDLSVAELQNTMQASENPMYRQASNTLSELIKDGKLEIVPQNKTAPSQEGSGIRFSAASGDVKFSVEIATRIYNALPPTDRAGLLVHSATNVEGMMKYISQYTGAVPPAGQIELLKAYLSQPGITLTMESSSTAKELEATIIEAGLLGAAFPKPDTQKTQLFNAYIRSGKNPTSPVWTQEIARKIQLQPQPRSATPTTPTTIY